MQSATTLSTLLIALASSAALVACDKVPDSRDAAKKLDATAAKVEQQVDQATAAAKSATDQARQAVANAADAALDKTRDAAITASIDAELAKDRSLSVLHIDVHTHRGRVALHGQAPDAAAKERATRLAQAVDGVKSVDNQLVVESQI